MSTPNEDLLEKAQWSPAKRIPPQPPLLNRATTWATNLASPYFSSSSAEQKKIRRTAWLDGLRGFAALLVYIGHHQLWSHEKDIDVFEEAWGYGGRYYFVSFPFIRFFFCGGHFAVTVFFVISGYVLSVKPLSLIHTGVDYVKLGDNLSSALFRRWVRLYLPLIVTTFIFMNVGHLLMTPAAPAQQGSYRDELWNWYAELKNFTFVFRTGGEPWFTYNFHAWSIPIEFKGSVAIYTVLIALARCTRNARLWIYLGLLYYFIYITDGWFCALFISGMMLSDLDLLALDDNLPSPLVRLEKHKKPIFYGIFAAAVWLGGCPGHTWELHHLTNSPGWYYLSFLKPQAVFDYKWFYLFFGSTALVASVPRIPILKSFFETPFCQYLGRISFALYLVHGPVLWTLGERIYNAVGFERSSGPTICPGWINIFPISKAGPLGLEPAFFASQVILLPITFWLAEVATTTLDEPSVKFAQWLYKKTLAPPVKL